MPVLLLQMPRGNLEVVKPRMLVLAAMAAALQERQYTAAWELATANRVSTWQLGSLPVLVGSVHVSLGACHY